MPTLDRLEQIVYLVDERGFLTVGDLSHYFQVSEMTIRRDLGKLAEEKRILRTYGGAASLRAPGQPPAEYSVPPPVEGYLVDRVEVLIATSVNPQYDGALVERLGRKNIPIIAESLATPGAETVVSVDNERASRELGQWAGNHALENWGGRAFILDLTYHLANTQMRSRAFISGVQDILPDAEVVLSLNAQSRYETGYQLTRDALTVHRHINIIFAINDIIAWGAIQACKDLNIDSEDLIVLPFGLEGDTLKDFMLQCSYCRAGLAMFPEIVGPVCIEAAISAYNHQPLERVLVTPYAVLTPENLTEYYEHQETGWKLRWEAVDNHLSIPLGLEPSTKNLRRMPRRIGFVVPFREHEWYRNLTLAMQRHASRLNIDFEIVDVEKNLEDEVILRRREIARLAAELVQPGDVILVDGGLLATELAEALINKQGITVITDAMPVFDILRGNPSNILILTGGAYRFSSQMLVGPTAEGALRELRADRLFLMVTGITFNFGLSHTNISEVTMKQAMIRSAREVILLADHTVFGQESVVQVAPLAVVNKLITDDVLPASIRLDLNKLVIEVILASS